MHQNSNLKSKRIKKQGQSRYQKGWLVLLIVSILITIFFWPSFATADSLSPKTAVEHAWRQATASGYYEYRSTANQITYPAPSRANVGQPPREDNLGAEGFFDSDAEDLNFTIWRDGSFNPETGIEIRSDGEKTLSRQGLGEWEEIQDVSGSFLPGGDPLGFFYGMTNIQDAGPDVRSFPNAGIELTFQRYTFDFDGPAFGHYIVQNSEKAMRENGELPPNMNLDIPQIYVQATGAGEIWLDEAGLPVRLKLSINYGAQENGEIIESHITTDYFGYDQKALAASSVTIFQNPAAWVGHQVGTLTSPDFQSSAMIGVAFVLFAIALLWVTRRYWWTREFYLALSLYLILSMLFAPLFNARELHAFSEQQYERVVHQEVMQAEVEERQEMIQALSEGSFDPHVDPFAKTVFPADSSDSEHLSQGFENPATPLATFSELAAVQTATTTAQDSDNDGLSDEDEDLVGSCDGTSNDPEICSSVADLADTDGDGLTDAEEVLILGTIATSADSDGDSISDYLEVTGFTDSNGTQWHLNPMDSDSNKDGIPDSYECLSQYDGNTVTTLDELIVACSDLDNDGLINIFDDDNDGDGVEDRVDHSPFDYFTGFTQETPLEIEVDNLAVDKPVIVTIELRPNQTEDLASYGHILDWPSGDRAGQIQRVYDTNWNTSANLSVSAPNGAYGDIRLTPMLEIQIDTAVDEAGNLPLLPNIQRTSGMAVDDWLDEDALTGYGVTVRDVYDENGDPTGELIAYVTLMPFSNSDGDETAGFAAKMLYQPSQASASNSAIADWGVPHTYRLVWLVEMLTDPCPDGNFNCKDSERLTDQYTIVHNYYEDWNLTGFSMSEQHGLEAAIITKDPNAAGSSDLNYPAEQANLAYNLAGTFITGRDCGDIQFFTSCTSDNVRDVTIATIDEAIDVWTNNEIDPFYIKNDISYPHKDYLLDVASSDATSVLDSQYTGSFATATPTLLFAYEYTERTIGLNITKNTPGVSPSLNMNDAEEITFAGMNWGSYRQVDNVWDIIPPETFIVELDAMLQENEAEFTLAGNQDGLTSTEDAAAAAQGKRMFMQTLYASVFQGLNGVVILEGTTVSTPEINFPAFLPTTGANIGEAYGVVEDYQDALRATGGITDVDSVKKFWKNYADARNFLISDELTVTSTKGSFKHTLLEGSALMGNALGSAIALASMTAFLAYTVCSECQDWAGAVINGAEIASNLADLGRLIRTVLSVNKFPTAVKNIAGSGGVVTIIVTVITLAVLWGVYIAEYAAKPDSLQKRLAAVVTIAATFVTVAFTIVSLLVMAAAAAATGVGAGFALAILVFLAVLGIWEAICGLAATCTGPISAITEWFANLSVKIDDPLIINLESDDRLDISYQNLELVDIDEGYTSANQLDYTMRIVNTLETYEDPDASDSRQAVFQYSLQEDTVDPYPDLTIDSIPKCPADPVCYEVIEAIRLEPYQTCVKWEDGDYVDSDSGGYYEQECVEYGTAYDPITGLRMTTTVSHAVDLTDSEGINTNIGSQLFVGESFSLPFQVCRLGPDGCGWYGTKEESGDEDESDDVVPGWNPIPLGEGQVFDILPATLHEFVSRNWNRNGSIALPTQKDADNDGILSFAHGGEDLNDTDADVDDDGLTDGFEILLNTDPTHHDSDDDGINDGDEFRYGTDPRKSDTDGDGLIDGEEIAGWLFTYRIDEDGTRHQTRVWSDPLERDTDGDQLSDLQERLLTFNPNVVDDPSVVENLIQIEEFEVSERTAPIAIWDFDESENATAFADRSGASHTASCDEAADSCPTAGVDGRYGQALDFDGTNDAIAATLTGPLANSSFTISAWAKRDSTGNWDVILNQGQNVLNKGLHLGFRSNNRFTCAFAGNDLTTSVAYTDTDWHHWACTYDVDTNERILYRDGVSVANDAPTGVYEGTGALIVGAAADSSFGNHHFDGMIDEVAIYNDAFTPEMILGLAKGGYYLDDLYVLPGATLDYQVTITNSHTLGATGILFNEANTYRPIEDAVSIDDSNRSYEELIAPPDVVLHLDATEFITTYVNSTQDTFSATCGIDNCPTPAEQVECNISLGNKDRCPSEPPNPDEIMPPVGSLINPTARYAVPVHGLGEFMTFDGVDDMLSIPHMAISPDVVIGFWVRFESLPANSNEKAYLLSSESEDGYSLYVDHNGSIFFEYGGQSTQLNDVSSNGPIQVVPGKWQHLVLKTSNERSGEFKLTSPYDDFSIADGDSYIIGEDFLSQSLSKIDSPQFGPGLIGNNAAGDGPFHGQITALALYHSPITAVYKVFDVFNNDNNWYSWRENARFTFDGGCDTGSETCKISPTLLLAFEDWGDDSLVTLENSVDGGDAYCETAASCPQPSTTTRDQYNEALVFDNNDRLLLDGINLANQSFTIAVWAKRDTIGSSDYIFGQGEDTESLGLHIGFRSNNKFTCAFWNDGLTTSTAYTDTDWHHWICSYDAETNLRQIFRDGVLVASNSASADYQGSGPFNIGSRFDENHYFDGSLDEIIIIPDAITEDNIQIGEAGTGAMVLASSRYPYVDITTEVDTDYQAFTLLSHESVTLSGSLEIDANLPSHVQRFNQQIDATIDIEEDLDVADGTNVVFYLPFNEDLSNLTDGSCVVGCPLGGFAGVNGRSALFDGDDDALKIENGVPTGTAMTFAAWVKADHGTIVDMREMHGRSIGDFTGWDGLEIDVDVVKLHGRNSTVFVPYSLPNNEWAHLTVVVNKGINWTVDAYVNGVHTGDTGSVAAGEVDSLGSGLAVVGMQKNMAHLLDGYLDDVYVYNEALNATQVQALYEGSRPILSMHFDETAGETAVVSDFGGVGQPSGPVGIGSEGRLGNGVNFNGESYLTVEGIDELDTLDNAFTIMAWVRPEALDGRQRILAHSRANSNDILSFGFSDKKLVFTTNAAEDYVSLDADIVEGEWQHVAVVFDSNNDATFYVNGGRLDKVNGNAPMNSNSNDDLLIGAAINPQGAISDHYIGDLDELVVYDKALTGGEIAEAFQWQFRTYREVGNAYITIDDDDPVVSLSSSSSLRANVPTWLSVEATDPSSPIRRLEIGQSGLNNSNIVWRDAPVCIDDTDAWCPQFAPAGEGAYQVQFRAVDAVGHFSTSSQTTFYVDATGPTVALDSTYNGQFLDANRPSGLELRWVLPLAGTISDPVISNTSVAGSGVNTETVAIQLIDVAGNIVGNSSQRVSVDAATGSWSVNYQFLTERPFGQYTVELLAEDVLGNKVSEAAQEIGSFWLDESPPTVKFLEGTVLGVPFDPYLPRDVFGDAQGVAPEIISEALTLEGVVTNGTEWPGAVAQYHFEDDEITTRIQDTSGTTHHATCDNCPQLGTGLNHFGQALDLTNQNTTVVVPHLVNPGTESFTAMAWFNASSIGGGSQVLIAQQDNEGTGRSWIYLDGAGRVSTFLGGQGRGSSFVVGADKWHHVAITYNGDELRLYVDGQVGLNEELESLESTLGDIIIGSHKGQAAQFFNGYIDEVSIYNRALSEEQILAAAQIPQNAIADVQIRVQEVGYAVGGETTTAIDWTSVTVDTTVEQVSKWSYILDNPQLEGYYQIQLRSSDSSGITEGASNIWRGWINRSGPKIDASIVGTEFSFTATDLMLDETTLSHSCDAADVVSMTYGNDAGVLSGEVYELSATCTLPAAGVDLAEVSVCDSFGLCASLNDFFTVETTLGTPIDIDVLANENASFSIETVGEPANGTVSFGSTITYTPAGSYVGEDSFGYTLTDGAGNNKSGIVNVTVICEANNGNLFSRIIACFNNQTEPGTKIIRLTSDVEVGDDINVLGVANYDKNIELIIDGAGYTVERSGSDKLLFLVVGSKVTFENLTFANVSSINSGGALGIINGSTVNVNNSSFINNQAVDGSAIYIENGTINIDSSTFDGNVAAEGGGAIYNETAAMSITNSTFTNNSAVNQGGAIYNEGQLTIEHSTLSGNSGANGGGIYTSNGNLLLVNTIVANSTSGGDCRSAAPISVDSGYNLISQNGTDACGLENGTNGNLTGVDPLLMPLADNGGDTLTIAIPANSPAVDAGDMSRCATFDQRGVERPFGNGCDIGAFEENIGDVATNNAPIVYYPINDFNGSTITDESGNGHIGGLFGNIQPSNETVTGSGWALTFDGYDDYVYVDDHNDLDLTGDMTIALWARPFNWYSGNHTALVVKGEGESQTANYYFGSWTDGALKLSYFNQGWHNVRDNSEASYNDGQWYHLTVVVDATNDRVRFYRDGILLSEQSHNFSEIPMVANGDPLILGHYLNSNDAKFVGMLDDVLIYDRALTSEEVGNIYNSGGSPLSGTAVGTLPVALASGTLLTLLGGFYLYNRSRKRNRYQ